MTRKRAPSPKEKIHADWLGMLQPEGLVVSVPVLIEADAYVRQPPETQGALRAVCSGDRLEDRGAFERLLTDVFGWPSSRLAGPERLDAFAVPLLDLGIRLRPDGALVDRDGAPLVFLAWSDGALDAPAGDTRWRVSRHQRFERLLLESQTGGGAGTPVGLHACPTALRLTYAPRGEVPGSLTFPIEALCTWDGRVLVDALLMLLGGERLFTVPHDRRLYALLAASRKRQEQVTIALAGQVEEALALLLAGVDIANTRTRGAFLRYAGDAPSVRAGLVGVLLRLVFLLFCEDSLVLPMDHQLYLDNYSLARLVEKLEDDRVLYPEAMRHRYGAWARLCALFRLVHGGVRHGDLVLPPRQGELFDPDRHPWLEGRAQAAAEPGDLPPIDDGVVADVLDGLVRHENQPIFYRNLGVEQLGSVYETLMALEVHRCGSRTVPVRGGGWLELGDVLDADQPLRVIEAATGLKQRELLNRAPALARFKVTGDRRTDEASLVHALGALLDGDRPERGPGQHVLIGGAERRRTGSHYTPASLTRPIVERTLDPVLGDAPSSARILDTKVCDPAMGSGAFLAEACRYLSHRLRDAWAREGALPPAEKGDPLLFARRMVAERCLYGVDKNPFAVQLARLSLWLVTLAKDQPFTFVDHALREGDAVIGLTLDQIAGFAFEPDPTQVELFASHIKRAVKDAVRDRAAIVEEAPLFDWRDEHRWKQQYLRHADDEVDLARRRGDLLIALAWDPVKGQAAKALSGKVRASADTWFLTDREKPLSEQATVLLATVDEVPLRPFHWALEFPEVFARSNPGFDAVLGNPPFLGGTKISTEYGRPYRLVIETLYPSATRAGDFVAYFFVQASRCLRMNGTLGLIATNSIAEADTRAAGLGHLLKKGSFEIYDATTDFAWPTLGATVTVSVVHAITGTWSTPDRRLNGVGVAWINSSLEAGPEVSGRVEALAENAGKVFQGVKLDGVGFALPLAEGRLLLDTPRNAEVIRLYLIGDDLNNSPTLAPSRYVIDFNEMGFDEAASYEEPFRIAEERVKPGRQTHSEERCRLLWWQFQRNKPDLRVALGRMKRVLALSRVSKHHLVAFFDSDVLPAEACVVFAFDDWFSFALLQSRVHEAWARSANLGSKMKTDPRYTPSTIFETFSFPRPIESHRVAAASAGQALDEQRLLCMRRFGEGMTKTWNRLLDADESDPEIGKLRELRDAMDRAVLAAYRWEDLDPDDTADIVTRLRALNARRVAAEKHRS